MLPGGEASATVTLLDRVFRTGTAESLAEQMRTQTPPAYWSYAVRAIIGDDDRPVGLAIQVTDSTETAVFRQQAVAMNEALLLSGIRQRELTEASEALNARLQAASEAKDHFLAVLSHELRNPLNPVLATASLLREDPRFDADTHEHLEVICRNVELEARLIDDLLDVTRISRGKVELNRRPIPLGTVLQHAVEVCQPDIDIRCLHFELNITDAPLTVYADAARLQQVFWNLIRNAVKFTPRNGCVGMRCWAETGQAVVEVSDSGVGIEPEAITRIFKAFEQEGRSTTRQFGGLGLGLAISKALVDLHGGTLAVKSEGRDRGATFTVRLPLVSAPIVASPTSPSAPAIPTATGNGQHVAPLHILLVEDHGDTARIMTRLLTRQGHQVHAAGDLATALDLAGERHFDLLLSDMGLPDGSGLDLLQELRKRGHTFPAIAVSGYGQDQDVQQSLAAGFGLHLTKPVDLTRLNDAVATLTAAPSNA